MYSATRAIRKRRIEVINAMQPRVWYTKLTGQGAQLVTLMLALGFVILFLGIWTAAFLNGGTIQVDVNHLGEGVPELVIWIIVFPVMIWNMALMIEDCWKR